MSPVSIILLPIWKQVKPFTWNE